VPQTRHQIGPARSGGGGVLACLPAATWRAPLHLFYSPFSSSCGPTAARSVSLELELEPKPELRHEPRQRLKAGSQTLALTHTLALKAASAASPTQCLPQWQAQPAPLRAKQPPTPSSPGALLSFSIIGGAGQRTAVAAAALATTTISEWAQCSGSAAASEDWTRRPRESASRRRHLATILPPPCPSVSSSRSVLRADHVPGRRQPGRCCSRPATVILAH